MDLDCVRIISDTVVDGLVWSGLVLMVRSGVVWSGTV